MLTHDCKVTYLTLIKGDLHCIRPINQCSDHRIINSQLATLNLQQIGVKPLSKRLKAQHSAKQLKQKPTKSIYTSTILLNKFSTMPTTQGTIAKPSKSKAYSKTPRTKHSSTTKTWKNKSTKGTSRICSKQPESTSKTTNWSTTIEITYYL